MGRDTAGRRGHEAPQGRRGDLDQHRRGRRDDLLVVTENGYGKRTRVSEYPVKGRGGMGVKTVQLTEARGKLVGARVVRDGYQVMLISTGGTVIRMPVEEIKRLGRSTQGVIVMRLRGRARRSRRFAPVVEAEDDDDARRRGGRRSPDAMRNPRDWRHRSALFQKQASALITFNSGSHPTSERDVVWRFAGQVDLLEPINLAEHLDKVELYLGQVCQIAGISKMQLDYWTNKAQIPTKGKKQRIYDMDALETVMLIKQAKDKGLNLGAAIEAARRLPRAARGSRAASSESLAPKPAGGGLRRQGVHVDARAELEPGEHRQSGDDLEVPVARRVEPEVRRSRALDRMQPAQPLRGELERDRRAPRLVHGSSSCAAGATRSSYGSRPAHAAERTTPSRESITSASSGGGRAGSRRPRRRAPPRPRPAGPRPARRAGSGSAAGWSPRRGPR